MKILKNGIPTVPKEKPWWYGMDAGCTTCGCIMRVEKGDKVVETRPDRNTGIIDTVAFLCPQCNNTVVLRRPENEDDCPGLDDPPVWERA